MPIRSPALAVALLAALALLAGCGSGSGSSGGSSAGGAGTTARQPSGPATIATSSTSLGTVLAVGGRAVYLFRRDTGPHSTCSGECLAQWPAVTTASAPQASGGATASMLGTTKRADGALQVTYAGHPLYYFADDSSAGQTNGQGLDAFGAQWYAVAPSGTAITKAAAGRSSGAGSGY